MTAFDFVVVGIVLISGIFAFVRGFVREALSLAAWILAAVTAYYAFPYAVPFSDRFLPRGAVADVAAAAVLFILALVVLHVIAKMAAGRIKHSALSPIDRTLGLLFGLARGLLLVCVGYIVLAWFWPPNDHRPRWFASAHSLPYLRAGADQIESFFSRSARPDAGAQGARIVDKEAEQAISAFNNPAPRAAAPAGAPPTYTPSEQRALNRLIQQKNTR